MSAPSSAESLQSTIPSTHHFVHHPATAWIGDKLRGKRGYPAEDMTLEQLSQRVSHVSIAPTDATRSVKYRWPACHKEQIVLDDEVWTGYEQTTRNGLLAADSPPAIFIKTSDANGDHYLEIIRNL